MYSKLMQVVEMVIDYCTVSLDDIHFMCKSSVMLISAPSCHVQHRIQWC